MNNASDDTFRVAILILGDRTRPRLVFSVANGAPVWSWEDEDHHAVFLADDRAEFQTAEDAILAMGEAVRR